MATSASNPVAASATKAGLARTARNPTAQWAAPAGGCVWMVSASVTANTAGTTALSSGARQTAAPGGSAWTESVSVKSPTWAWTVGS